ncbi:MAG: hypothetical protein AWU57_329 [Marinobacter sp. T13-3]|nr:MAG: hypothetical protein AWU57_329 [Marinobacter sp. T13-3]
MICRTIAHEMASYRYAGIAFVLVGLVVSIINLATMWMPWGALATGVAIGVVALIKVPPHTTTQFSE